MQGGKGRVGGGDDDGFGDDGVAEVDGGIGAGGSGSESMESADGHYPPVGM